MHGRRQRGFASTALMLALISGYLLFATIAATCVDHQTGSHHHAGQTAHHHPLCGETQCSGAAIATDGQSALIEAPAPSGSAVASAVPSIAELGVSLSSSRAPPLSLV